jgi:hypothetical protein
MRLIQLFRSIRPAQAKTRRSTWRPTLEVLEDRTTPTTFSGPVYVLVLPTPLLVHVTVQPPSETLHNAAVGPIVAHTLSPVVPPSLGMTAVSPL